MTDWRSLVETVTALVRRRAGITGAGGRDVATAMKRVMKAEQRANPTGYLELLETDDAAFDALIGELTVGETYFLRESQQLDFLRRAVIPDLARRRSGIIHAWSAGCASGEEAYTLSLLFHEAGLGGRTRILGTDIARDRLRQARRARYRPWSFRGVPEEARRRYFRATRADFEVLPELRGCVEFRYLNLLDADYRQAGVMPGGMDLILCRNVLIYLDRDSAAQVARGLFDALSPDGWLLTAAADPGLRDLIACEAIVTGSGVIYRKTVRAALRASALAAALPTHEDIPADVASGAHTAGPVAERGNARRLGSRAPDPVETLVARVRDLADRAQLQRAGLECAAARERHPDSAELAYLESVLLFEAGSYAAAAEAARRALYLDPRLAVAHLALGGAWARLGRVEAARRALGTAERLLSALPADAVVPAAGGASAGVVAELARARLRQVRDLAS